MTIDSVLTKDTIVYVKTLERRNNKVTYGRNGKYKVISADNKMILLQKEGSGYRECISVIDLRLKRYKILLENKKPIIFKPLKQYEKSIHGYRW